MNTQALILFLFLLLGLVLCSFLGGNCYTEGMEGQFTGTFQTNSNDNTNTTNTNTNTTSGSTNGASTGSSTVYDNYNHYNGSSTQLSNGTTFYGANGGSVVVNTNSDGSQSLKITLISGDQPMTFYSSPPSSTSPTAANTSSSTEGYTNYSGANASATTFYGPDGDVATVVTGNNGQQAINVQTPGGSYTFTQSGSYYNPNNISSTQYYGSTGYNFDPTVHNQSYYGPYGGSAGSVTGPNGNTAYYSSLPPGIPASQIPPGNEDLYILKSEVVPPVCPACPVSSACPREEPCPPCPACARCPEPSFECKKVPNYNAINEEYLPVPVLNDFSQFGM